MKVEGE